VVKRNENRSLGIFLMIENKPLTTLPKFEFRNSKFEFAAVISGSSAEEAIPPGSAEWSVVNPVKPAEQVAPHDWDR
jgi:hypothetical protein